LEVVFPKRPNSCWRSIRPARERARTVKLVYEEKDIAAPLQVLRGAAVSL
jgi:hypothetical protein